MLLIKSIKLYSSHVVSKRFTLLLQAEEKAQSTQTSSEGSSSKAPYWDTAFVRAYNQVKDRPATEQPHKGRVVGAGKHHKHPYYYPVEAKELRKERRRFEEMDIKAAVDKEVQATVPGLVQQQLAQSLTAIMPSLMQSVKPVWMEEGKQGPFNIPSFVASNSNNQAPTMDVPAANPTCGREDATPAAINEVAKGVSPASVDLSSPSIISSTLAHGPTPLAELEALTVIKRHKSQQIMYIPHPWRPLLRLNMHVFAGRRGGMHVAIACGE